MKRYTLTFEYLEPMELHFPVVQADSKDQAIEFVRDMLSRLDPQPEGLRLTNCEEVQELDASKPDASPPPITIFGKRQ